MIIDYYCGRPAWVWARGKQANDQPPSPEASISSFLRRAFLPEGYPESVTSDYMAFQFWDTVQALSSYVRGMLSSQAILRGVGVGQQAATPLSAVFQFFVRDLTGMLGGIMFAFCYGSSFDSYAKQWRLLADVVNDIGMAVELASPFFPAAFLVMACFGSIARAITGVAGGATRAALTQHFARQGNTADIAAKEQSQEVATTMAGMALGMACTRSLSGHPTACWALFLLLTCVHVAANVRAMRCLVLSSLNGPRLDVLLDSYLDQTQSVGSTSQGKHKALTPAQVADIEDLTPPPVAAVMGAVGVQLRFSRTAASNRGSRGSSSSTKTASLNVGVASLVGSSGTDMSREGGITHGSSPRTATSCGEGTSTRSCSIGREGAGTCALQGTVPGARYGGSGRIGGVDASGRRPWCVSFGACFHELAGNDAERAKRLCRTLTLAPLWPGRKDPLLPTTTEPASLPPPPPPLPPAALLPSLPPNPSNVQGTKQSFIPQGAAIEQVFRHYKVPDSSLARYILEPRNGVVYVVLHHKAVPSDIMQAYIHARLLVRLLNEATTNAPRAVDLRAAGHLPFKEVSVEADAIYWMVVHYSELCGALLAAGWNLGRVILSRPSWTADWGDDQLHED